MYHTITIALGIWRGQEASYGTGIEWLFAMFFSDFFRLKGYLEQVDNLDVEIRVVEEVLGKVRQKGIHGIFQHDPSAFFFELLLQ